MKINLGCGFNKLEGFLNVDSDKRCNPDKVVDFKKGKLPFKDNEVTSVVANHFFEKCGDNFLPLMQEIYRVCEHGTVIEIQFVHPNHNDFVSNPLNVRPLSIDTFRHFGKKYGKMQEKAKKELSLAEQLDVDFEVVDFVYGVDALYSEALKENNMAQVEELSKRFNNVYREVGLKLLVLKA